MIWWKISFAEVTKAVLSDSKHYFILLNFDHICSGDSPRRNEDNNYNNFDNNNKEEDKENDDDNDSSDRGSSTRFVKFIKWPKYHFWVI